MSGEPTAWASLFVGAQADAQKDAQGGGHRHSQPDWARYGEESEFGLSLGGRYAGRQHWSIRRLRGSVEADVQTELSGALPVYHVRQLSRLHPRTLALIGYSEGEGYSSRPSFELTLDYRAGLVRLWQRGVEAEGPLVQPFLDPVALLLWLREWPADVGASRIVHLAGGGNHVQRLEDTALNAEGGEQVPVQAFYIRPGGARVWVEQGGGRRLLQIEQPTRYGPLLAVARELGGMVERQRERRRVRAG